MINNEYFDIYHSSRDNAPDGLIDRSNLMLDVVNILEHLYEMKPYTRRGPALTEHEYLNTFATIKMRLSHLQ